MKTSDGDTDVRGDESGVRRDEKDFAQRLKRVVPLPIQRFVYLLVGQYVKYDDEFSDNLRKISVAIFFVASWSSAWPMCIFVFYRYGNPDPPDSEPFLGYLIFAVLDLVFCILCSVCYFTMCKKGDVPRWLGSLPFCLTCCTCSGAAVSTFHYPLGLTTTATAAVAWGAGFPVPVRVFLAIISFCGTVYDELRSVWPETFGLHDPNGQTFATFLGISFAVAANLVILFTALGNDLMFGSTMTHVSKANRDNSHALRESPVTVMFTDIESSSHLWATVPDVMQVALEEHNMVLRSCISKYKGYEVKTVGDSFVVVFSSSDDAVRCALEMQEQLYRHAWTDHGGLLDSVYREKAAVDRDADGDLPPNVPADDTTYNSLWRGMRVRVALHHGPVDIKFDQTTKGYDYFGTTMNVTARLEGASVGGVVTATQELLDSLKDPTTQSAFVHTDFGMVNLRGIKEPVHMHQLLPHSLAERKFPRRAATQLLAANLQAHRSTGIEDATAAHGDRSSQMSTVESEGETATNINVVAADLEVAVSTATTIFSVLPARARQRMILELCKAWRLEYRDEAAGGARSNFERLARRVYAVVQVKQQMNQHHQLLAALQAQNTSDQDRLVHSC